MTLPAKVPPHCGLMPRQYQSFYVPLHKISCARDNGEQFSFYPHAVSLRNFDIFASKYF